MHNAQEQQCLVAHVLLDDALDKPLDYALPPQFANIERGSRVAVPVRGSIRKGTIVDILLTSSFKGKLQPISEILSESPLLLPNLLELAEWMAKYYVTPLRKVLRLFLPTTIRSDMKNKEQLFIKREISQKAMADLTKQLLTVSPSQAKVLEILLKKPKGMLLTELLEKSGVSKSPIETLIQKKVLSAQKVQLDRSPTAQFTYLPTKPKTLSGEQKHAFDAIAEAVSASTFSPFLLHGVTGSGKTEVYMQAIAHARSLEKSALMLVPEISLTSQTIERFRSRFDEPIGILHHRLSDGERTDVWRGIHSGKIRLVIGARSSIFSPLKNLGLIIVDEEHDGSYKQSDEMPCYNGRDIAVLRAKKENATVVLGSATPSLESFLNAKEGKYTLLSLLKRPESAKLPTVEIVDMKREYEKFGGFTLFSNALIDGMKRRLEKGEQILLFLNRRGYHALSLCTKCNHIEKCPHCDISLTFHKNDHVLACHQCGYMQPPLKACSKCGESAFLKMKGCGTELVEKAVHALFKDVRTLRMDADTTRHKGSHEILFKQFRSGKADVLIGTQMIAKGLHFPSVTLVGVLNVDQALNIPEFRSSEVVFQLLAQVAGRSGRGALPGEVVIQTLLKDHFTFQTASKEDYLSFYSQEIEFRKLLEYPPFSQLAKCILSGENESLLVEYGKRLQTLLSENLPEGFEVFPLVPCAIAKIKDKLRYKLLVKGTPIHLFSAALPRITPPLPEGVRLLIDIAPLSTS